MRKRLARRLTRLRRWALRRLRGRCGVVYDGTFPQHHGAACERYKGHPSLHADNPHTISWNECKSLAGVTHGWQCRRANGHEGLHVAAGLYAWGNCEGTQQVGQILVRCQLSPGHGGQHFGRWSHDGYWWFDPSPSSPSTARLGRADD